MLMLPAARTTVPPSEIVSEALLRVGATFAEPRPIKSVASIVMLPLRMTWKSAVVLPLVSAQMCVCALPPEPVWVTQTP